VDGIDGTGLTARWIGGASASSSGSVLSSVSIRLDGVGAVGLSTRGIGLGDSRMGVGGTGAGVAGNWIGVSGAMMGVGGAEMVRTDGGRGISSGDKLDTSEGDRVEMDFVGERATSEGDLAAVGVLVEGVVSSSSIWGVGKTLVGACGFKSSDREDKVGVLSSEGMSPTSLCNLSFASEAVLYEVSEAETKLGIESKLAKVSTERMLVDRLGP
jgi:hypothetical protein